MHDLILWLATKLEETPKTVEQLNQAYIAIERKDKFGCMYALTSLVDELEAQGTQLPQRYLGTIDQVCQEATELVENSLQGKQVGGDLSIPVLSPLALGGIGAGIIVLIGLMIWVSKKLKKEKREVDALTYAYSETRPNLPPIMLDTLALSNIPPLHPKELARRANRDTPPEPYQLLPSPPPITGEEFRSAENDLVNFLEREGIGALRPPSAVINRYIIGGIEDPVVKDWLQDQLNAVA